MSDKNSAKKTRSLRKRYSLRPRSVNYYLNFTLARKKLGTIATRSFFQVKDFLNNSLAFAGKTAFV